MTEHKTQNYFGRDLEAMSFAINYHKWILEEFKPYFGNKVAEVGAGSGNFSELLIENLEQLTVFEPSDNMYPLLNQRFTEHPQVQSVHSTFIEAPSEHKTNLDTVIYVNVLEHIKDDAAELSHIFDVLQQGGHALIFVPALRFLYSNLDKDLGHFRRYHKKDLINLAHSSGFSVVKMHYFDFTGIVPWYIWFVLCKKTMISTHVSYYDRIVVPIIQKIEQALRPPIGKNLLMVLKKRG